MYILNDLAIETTRRCNLKCGHCMRGEAQDIDISKEIVDMILDNEEIVRIHHLCFSGGEPTLNPEIIIYAIDKIISERKNVLEIVTVTNGQIFNRELVEAFNRFNQYRNERLRQIIEEKYKDDKASLEKALRDNTDEHARISLSTDRFHHPIPQEVRDNYNKYCKGILLVDKDIDDKNLFKTGFSKIGNEFNYTLKPLRYFKERDYYLVFDNIYITANGFITSEGNGQYEDMDRINMGNISDTSLTKVLANYGVPKAGAPKIEYCEDTLNSGATLK